MPEPYILFEVAGATYAVHSEQVQQVEMLASITRVPNTPEFIEGVTAIRGQVVPVVQLRRRFHLDPVEPNLRSRLIVVRVDGRRVAMLADTAREFAQLAPEQIQPPPADLAGPGVEYLDGVATVNGRLILVVNLQKLLTASEKQALPEEPSPGATPVI
jgi:purine-binding chemotaxis protein CheW